MEKQKKRKKMVCVGGVVVHFHVAKERNKRKFEGREIRYITWSVAMDLITLEANGLEHFSTQLKKNFFGKFKRTQMEMRKWKI